MQIKDKTIVITGAAQGIGRAIAMDLAGAGAALALIDLDAEALAPTREACLSQGAKAIAYAANVADEAAVSDVMSRIAGDFGRLDGLVNNAGIVRDALLLKVKNGALVGKMSLDQWQRVIDVNLTGVYLCAREAAAWMVQFGQGGVLINISSISRSGNAGQSNYSAAKAGVAALTVVWAKELARFGIRTGAIAPGYVRTDILSSMKPEVLHKVVEPVPLKRLGEATEIAHAVRFAFENDFFTGRCIDLDGGLRI